VVGSPKDWTGKRVTVMGLGTRGGGSGVARYLAGRGAMVTVTDLREESALADQIAELADLDIRFVLGRHDEADFTDTDCVVRNPAVRRWNPLLTAAREAGVPIEMEMTLFLAASSAPVIGITGTKGKTSTSMLCGEILRAWNPNTVVAGNMGVSAVAALDRLRPTTPVVLELSSWQLEAMDDRKLGPRIAVLTNISPDHLDTYADFDDYAATKRSIATHLTPADTLVLNADDPEVVRAADQSRARIIWFGASVEGYGIQVLPDRLRVKLPDQQGELRFPDNRALTGHHMRMNAAAAAAAALVRGAYSEHVSAGLASFRGIANRTERVGTVAGVEYINDTAATAPAAAIASLTAFADRPIHLIAGGADKKLDMTALADTIARTAVSVVLLDGTATPILAELIHAVDPEMELPIVQSMEVALTTASSQAQSGDIVLLSPGCASFGIFRDEFDRGQQFRDGVYARMNADLVR
jgi:UDP-N-acetylmuramoylalanine--D-glutamate ligase